MVDDLRTARRKMLMTQAELAKKSGVSRTTIVKIEKGDMPESVCVRTLKKLAEALQRGINDINFFA